MLTLVGLHPEAAAMAWALQKRGIDVALVEDGGDLLAGFGGATRVETDVSALLADVDPALVTGEALVASALGVVRAVNVAHRALLRLQKGERVHVVGFLGWREWSAGLIAEGLEAAGVPATVVNAQLFGASADASFSQLARRMTDVQFRAAVATGLEGAKRVLLPPILGTTTTGVPVQEAFGIELGAVVGMAVATTPSPIGEAHLDNVRRALPLLAAPEFLREGDDLVIAGRRGRVLAFGPKAHERLRKLDAAAPSPARNVEYVTAPRALGEAWCSGLSRAEKWQ
jgi:hypothetical protein